MEKGNLTKTQSMSSKRLHTYNYTTYICYYNTPIAFILDSDSDEEVQGMGMAKFSITVHMHQFCFKL